MALKLILISIAVIGTIVVYSSRPESAEIKSTVHKLANGKSYTTYEFEFGGSEGSAVQNTEFMLDLGYPSVLIGHKESAEWGVHCNKDFGCKIVSEEEKAFFYFCKQFFAKKALSRIGSPAFKALKPTLMGRRPTRPRDEVQVELVTRGNKWNHADAGVLGLAPYGSFISFMRNYYPENLGFMIHFKSDHRKPANLEFTERLFVNPAITSDNLLATVLMEDGDQFWTVKADLKIGNKSEPEWDFQNAPVCLTNIDEAILVAVDPIDRCNDIRRRICKGKIGKQCITKEADFSQAPELVFKIAGKEFKFTYKDYLYPGASAVVECRFGDVSALRPIQNCHPNSEFAFGKLFFEKYPLIINFTRDERPSVTFLKNFYAPAPSRTLSAKVIFLAAIGILLLLLVTVYVFVRKVKSDSREYPDFQTPTEKQPIN